MYSYTKRPFTPALASIYQKHKSGEINVSISISRHISGQLLLTPLNCLKDCELGWRQLGHNHYVRSSACPLCRCSHRWVDLTWLQFSSWETTLYFQFVSSIDSVGSWCQQQLTSTRGRVLFLLLLFLLCQFVFGALPPPAGLSHIHQCVPERQLIHLHIILCINVTTQSYGLISFVCIISPISSYVNQL